MNHSSAPQHGGDLAAAALRYGIAAEHWLDLSTGINPHTYPANAIEPALLQRLPVPSRELLEAARDYCGAPLLPVIAAGSQALIQWLPPVRARTASRSRVAVPNIGYAEHEFRWRWSGHDVHRYDAFDSDAIDTLLARDCPDVLVVVNPHNPLGAVVDVERLLAWRETIAARGGWLIVDEAFIDATPQYSVTAHSHLPGLIVLRSLGKFFGLAGLRFGYALCNESLRTELETAVGPWPLAGASAQLALTALRDRAWQRDMCGRLYEISAANAALLQSAPWCEGARIRRAALFNSVMLPSAAAEAVHAHFARAGILLRIIAVDNERSMLRFGLVDIECAEHWQRFKAAAAAPTA